MNSKFSYDSNKLILSKSLSLYNANLCATANGILKAVFTEDIGPDIFNSLLTGLTNFGQTDIALGGISSWPKELYFDYPNITEIKEQLQDLATDISKFDEEVDKIINAIIDNMEDEDLAAEFKKNVEEVEKSAMKEYLTLGAKGVGIDVVQLYKLLSKYKDDPTLDLDDSQREMLKIYCDKMDFENMSALEKGFQTCVVFGASAVNGVLDVSESIVDGALYYGGQAVSLGLTLLDEEEMADVILDGVENIVDKDYSSMAYDDFVNMAGLNNYIAYGDVHKLGLSVGHGVGESLMVMMIPGGGCASAVACAALAAGETLEDTVGYDRDTRNAKVFTASAFSVADFILDKVPDGKVKESISLLFKESETALNGVIDYYENGEQGNMLGYVFSNNGGEMLTGAATSVINLKKGPDMEVPVEQTKKASSEIFESALDGAKDGAKEIAGDISKDIINEIGDDYVLEDNKDEDDRDEDDKK